MHANIVTWYLLALGATAHSVSGPKTENRAAQLMRLPADASLFSIDSREQALSKLKAKAEATPSAVNLDRVPLSRDSHGRIHKTQPTASPKAHRSLAQAPEQPRYIAAGKSCPNPIFRPEWRNMADGQKQQYVDAISCITTKPSRSGVEGAQTLWDDFAGIHQQLMPTIHHVGIFLPWHRWFLRIFQLELGNTCNYTGPLPWWDETLDAGHFASAPMFTDQSYGAFPVGEGCVPNGRFQDLEINIGPTNTKTKRCLSRNLNEEISALITNERLEICWAYQNYKEWADCIESAPHGIGHNAVGSVMADVWASPADPVFFLHHAFIDRAWQVWQAALPENRTDAISGYTTPSCNGNSYPGPECVEVTLDTPLEGLSLYPDVPARDVMDTQALCYVYDY